MNYSEFVQKAIRTESQPDSVVINREMYNALITSSLRLADNLDLIKKNVFYGKEVDLERFNNNIKQVSEEIENSLQSDQVENYLNQTESVAINPRVFHGVIGVVTEALELAELIDLDSELPSRLKVSDELGDSAWYTAILCDSMGLDMEDEILVGVISKLLKRFPEKFESALAISRDKNAELEAVENVLSSDKKA